MRFLILVLVGLVLGCGDARTELADRGIAYTKGAFLLAAEGGDLAVVKLFVESGMSVHTAANDYGLTVLHRAAWKGHTDVVRYLVEQGADVNAKTDDGDTVLGVAAWEGQTDVVRYLVEQGADVNAKTDKGGWTALHGAAEYGHLAVVRYLVEQGADVNAKNSADWTALAGAVSGGHTEVAAYLKSVGG